jgi:hypothetical protein
MLLELGLPGLVFLALCIWLIRKALKAARTEGDLEQERLTGALADELRAARARAALASAGKPLLAPAPPAQDERRDPLVGADLRGANPEHVRLVLELERDKDVEVAWVRSSSTHVAWCERQLPRESLREVICVARVENGALLERWSSR